MPSPRTTRIAAAFGTLMSALASGCGKSPAPPDSPPAPGDGLADEAGFVDVPSQPSGSPHDARLFYAFQVADTDAANKPLAVFTAGGPGYPSSLELLPYGTARRTLPSPTAPNMPAIANPASWTSFANLLFIDERQSGFSYELDTDSAAPDASACSFDPEGDAADFVRVILGFLDAHAALRRTPVILVGQSYGGERATLILDLLLRYGTEVPAADPALRATIQAHYDAVFPAAAGAVIDPALSATQFGRVVLLQPFVLGGRQYATQDALIPNDPYVGNVAVTQDVYDVRQPSGWSVALDDTAAIAFGDFDRATNLLSVDPRAIGAMVPGGRSGAFRISAPPDGAQAQTNALWTAALGPLAAGDAYLVSPATACPADPSLYDGPGSEDAFLANLRGGVHTFISDARYDDSIYAPAIPAALQTVATINLDTTPRPGVSRPGWFTVTFGQDGGVAPPIEVRFPPYADSGHFVALAEPQALHDDVVAWIESAP